MDFFGEFMSYQILELLTLSLIALFFALSSIELLRLLKQPQFIKIWNYDYLKIDLEKAFPLFKKLLPILFSNSSFKWVLYLQLILAAFLILIKSPWIVGCLIISHLLICIRFRGTYNGGSDMMAFVLLTGALVLTSFKNQDLAQFGFLYIAIHTLYSYLKAGLSKVVQKDWRSGFALSAFLSRSLYPDIKKLSVWLDHKKNISLMACWLVIIFELAALLIVLFPRFAIVYFIMALVFHFSVFLTFGLNRFFWAWLAAWPSIFYSLMAFGLTTK